MFELLKKWFKPKEKPNSLKLFLDYYDWVSCDYFLPPVGKNVHLFGSIKLSPTYLGSATKPFIGFRTQDTIWINHEDDFSANWVTHWAYIYTPDAPTDFIPLRMKKRKATKMQEIITEILKSHGFPTKNVDELVASLGNLAFDDLLSITVIAVGDAETGCILAYCVHPEMYCISRDDISEFSNDRNWRYCSLGSELVARLKGGE